MTAGRYIEGVLLTLLCAGALIVGARRLRAALLPGWDGAAAWVADAVIVLGAAIVVLQAIGVVGLLVGPAAVAGCLVAGALMWALAGRLPAVRSATRSSAAPLSRLERLLSAGALAAVAAPWIGWTVYAYRHGMENPDTLWYHLPQAARFVQAGNILHLQYFDSDPVTVFYPANAELLHALGLMLWGSDVVSPLINLGWGALALLSAWAIGRPLRRGPHCLLAVAAVLVTPVLVATQPGGAYNDTACIALTLAAVALLMRGRGDSGLAAVAPATLAALAAGLALGTKFTMIVPALLLGAFAVALVPRGARLRQAAISVLALALLGGFWYLRDWIATGDPVPATTIHLGPLWLRAPHISAPVLTVAQFITSGHVWSTYYLPGLHRAFGPAWWALLILAALGTLAAVAMPRVGLVLRLLGVLAGAGAVAYVFSPQLLGLPGAPVFFVYNLRYAVVPLALSFVLVPLLPLVRGVPAGRVWLAVAALIILATELDPAIWPTALNANPFSAPLRGAPALAGAAVGVIVFALVAAKPWLRATAAARARGLTVGAAVVVAVAGWFVADSYAKRRYAAAGPVPTIFRWAQSVHHARIGIVGIVAQYPLYGPDDSNYVQYVGRGEPRGGFGPITTCTAWRDAVDRGRYGWLVVAPLYFPLAVAPAPELAWTRSLPGAREVIDEHVPGGPQGDAAVLFRITRWAGGC